MMSAIEEFLIYVDNGYVSCRKGGNRWDVTIKTET